MRYAQLRGLPSCFYFIDITRNYHIITVFHRNVFIAKPVLRVQLQSGDHFEYWTAYTSSEGAGFTCFAKKLPGIINTLSYQS